MLPKLKFFNTFNFFWAWSVCKAFFQRLWNSPALKRTKKEMFQKGVNHLWFASLYMCICQSKCCRENNPDRTNNVWLSGLHICFYFLYKKIVTIHKNQPRADQSLLFPTLHMYIGKICYKNNPAQSLPITCGSPWFFSRSFCKRKQPRADQSCVALQPWHLFQQHLGPKVCQWLGVFILALFWVLFMWGYPALWEPQGICKFRACFFLIFFCHG